jgi:glycosylphosphatidylinositol transamidase
VSYLNVCRIVESTLRTANNLLERLHASFFFYILTGPDHFLKIGSYLPSAVLISVAMMLGGLRTWADAGWFFYLVDVSKAPKGAPTTKWSRRQRPVLKTLSIMIVTHLLGALLFTLVQAPAFIDNRAVRNQTLLLTV